MKRRESSKEEEAVGSLEWAPRPLCSAGRAGAMPGNLLAGDHLPPPVEDCEAKPHDSYVRGPGAILSSIRWAVRKLF